MKSLISNYLSRLHDTAESFDWAPVERLAEDLLDAAKNGKQVFICGNGGSAGNAIHIANDFLYGIAPKGHNLRVDALSANQAIMTCLGNDLGYEFIYSHQLKVKALAGDILIVLSGSGNSPNILEALKVANERQLRSYAVLGFSGGKAKSMATESIHFPVDDMQIAEDLQLIVGHILMKFLCEKLGKKNND